MGKHNLKPVKKTPYAMFEKVIIVSLSLILKKYLASEVRML